MKKKLISIFEGSRGLKRHYRKKMDYGKQIADISPGKLRKHYKDAFTAANELNKKHQGKVPVYHMINMDRLEYVNKTLDEALAFLFSSALDTEVSVSVMKGVWDTKNSIILEGKGKLSAYYPTDVYTQYDQHGHKVAKQPDREEDSHHWDEGTIRLSDVVWEDIYVSDELPYSITTEIKDFLYDNELDDDVYVRDMSEGRSSYMGNALSKSLDYEEDVKQYEEELDSIISDLNRIYDDIDTLFVKYRKEFQKEEFFEIFGDLYFNHSKFGEDIPDSMGDIYPERVVETPEEHLEQFRELIQNYNELYSKFEEMKKDIEEKYEENRTEKDDYSFVYESTRKVLQSIFKKKITEDEWDELLIDPPGHVSSNLDDNEVEETRYPNAEDAGDIKIIKSPLYHGSYQDRSEQIKNNLILKSRPEFKTSGGLLSEGGLIWFVDDKDKAKEWSTGTRDPIAGSGKNRERGNVYTFTHNKHLLFINRRHALSNDEAKFVNEFYGIPEYKQLKEGDKLILIEHRYPTFDKELEEYTTDKGTMTVLYPPLLKEWGYDGIYDDSGFALGWDKDIKVRLDEK